MQVQYWNISNLLVAMLFLNRWIKNKGIVYEKLLVCFTHPMNTLHFMPDLFTAGLENTMLPTDQNR